MSKDHSYQNSANYNREQKEHEYAPLRLPPNTTPSAAAIELAIRAEFGDWELAHLQRYADGTRRILLRRRKHRGTTPLPGLSA